MPRRNRRYSRRTRGRYYKKAYGGPAKRMIDGNGSTGLVRAGVAAIPYLFKSVRLLKSLVNAEPKYIDLTATANPTSATVNYSHLTSVAQGTTDQTRIGNKILLKDIIFRLQFTINTAATATHIRGVLYVDKEFDGAHVASPLPLAALNTEAPLDLDNSKRFVVLKDVDISLSINGNRTYGMKIYKRLNFHTDYDGAGSGVATGKQNQLIFAYLSNESTNTPTMAYYSRVKFYDS